MKREVNATKRPPNDRFNTGGLQEAALVAEQQLIAGAQAIIREGLRRHKMTHRALATRMGVHRTYIGHLLGPNPHNLTLKTIARIAHAFGEVASVETAVKSRTVRRPWSKMTEAPQATRDADGEIPLDAWRGHELRRIRIERGLTQDQLAQRIGLSREMVSLMEKGRKPISRRTQIAISTI